MLAPVQDRGSARRTKSNARSVSMGVSTGAALILATVAGSAQAAIAPAPAPAAEAPSEAAATPAPANDVSADTEASPADAGETTSAPPEEDSAEADAPSDDATDDESEETETSEPVEEAEAPRPPRIDGVYLGGMAFGGIGLMRLNDIPTSGPFTAFGGTATIGQMVFPWLGLGLTAGGAGGVRSESGARQTLGQGQLGFEFKFVPLPKRIPLSLRASFGFGGGAVRQEGVAARSGFGGPQFGAAVRYEFFPWAKRFRPFKGGGFGLGPELGWTGFTPAAAGRPMSNIVYLALSTTFYFGD
ncbi:MAG: hypothetical protein AAF799_32240 [Myxococcota bacterium]